LAFVVRGSVVWVALDPARGAEVPKTRPCVIVSRDIANEISQTVTIVPPSSLRGRAQEGLVQPIMRTRETRLSKDSRARCDQIRTIDQGRIQRIVGIPGPEAMQRIDRGLVLHLKLEEYVRLDS
jgi:mRNA interferase MazF